MDKETILDEIEDKHADMEGLLATMNEQQMTQPNVYGELSVKDVLAHITAWERLMLAWLKTSQAGETPVRFAPGFTFEEDAPEDAVTEVMDRLNQHIYAENKDKSLEEVMAEFEVAHADVVEAIQDASEEDLTDPNRFPWRNGRPFSSAVEGNTYGHYQEHVELIRTWLADGK